MTVTDAEPDVLIDRVMRHAYGEQRLKSTQDLVRSTNLNGDVLQQGVARLVERGELVRFTDRWLLHRHWYMGLKDELISVLEKMHRVQRLKDTLPKDAPRLQLSWPAPDTVYDALLRDLDEESTVVMSGRSIRLTTHAVSLTVQEEEILEAFDRLGGADPPAVFSMNDLVQVMEEQSATIGDLQVDLSANPDMIKSMATYALEQGIFVEFLERQILHRMGLESARGKVGDLPEKPWLRARFRVPQLHGHLQVACHRLAGLFLRPRCDQPGIRNPSTGGSGMKWRFGGIMAYLSRCIRGLEW